MWTAVPVWCRRLCWFGVDGGDALVLTADVQGGGVHVLTAVRLEGFVSGASLDLIVLLALSRLLVVVALT